MKYYITVTTLQSTTKLGRLLADKVKRRYNCALVSQQEADNLPRYISDEMAALREENKRLKPMTVRTWGYVAGKVRASAQIHTVTETGAKAFTDNRPFTLYISPVLKDYTTDA